MKMSESARGKEKSNSAVTELVRARENKKRERDLLFQRTKWRMTR